MGPRVGADTEHESSTPRLQAAAPAAVRSAPPGAPAVQNASVASGTDPGSGAQLAAAFTETMAHLASAVAVVTSRQDDGSPCGLLVSSVCSYSVAPPSVLVAVAQSARACPALVGGAPFGVHLLGGADTGAAEVFARRDADKFRAVRWGWDGPVPRLADVPWYLRCVPTAVLHHGDHAVVVGEVERCVREPGRPREPLVYYRRRLGWQLAVPADPGPAPRPPPNGGRPSAPGTGGAVPGRRPGTPPPVSGSAGEPPRTVRGPEERRAAPS